MMDVIDEAVLSLDAMASTIAIPENAVDLFPNRLGPKIFHLQKDNNILKAGFSVKLSEAEAMQFVARETSIPVPKVLEAYVKDGNGYIFMSMCDGKPLGDMWDTLNVEQRALVISQLKIYMKELSSLNGEFYGALWNMASEDIFFKHLPFRQLEVSYGPFCSRQKYNEGLVQALMNSRPGSALDDSDRELAERLLGSRDEAKVFSHGDFHPWNILVNEDGTVTGIIDWDGAGFSIRGREYYEARARSRNGEWSKALESIFDEEERMDYDLLKDLDRALVSYTGI